MKLEHIVKVGYLKQYTLIFLCNFTYLYLQM